MSVITTLPVGTFCWPELCSANAPASKKFYSSLFGWEPDDIHMPEGDYTMFKLGGQGAGAMYEMKEERKKAGVRPHWNSYVAVSDADETARKATLLGGRVLMGPFDADGDRMANLEDPTGVKFSIWQAIKRPQAIHLNEAGALCWTELLTRDPKKAIAFYTGLFGWRTQPFKGGPMPYTLFNLAGEERGVGGMMAMPEEMKGEPQWLPYFMVEDTDKTVERTRRAGGKIINPPMDIPKIGRIAMLADPLGAAFAIIKPTMGV